MTSSSVPDYFTEMKDCLQTCPKLQESRAPLMENAEDVSRVIEKIVEMTKAPAETETVSSLYRAYYPRALSDAVWVSVSYREEEGGGVWRDFYTNEELPGLVEAHRGDISGGEKETCGIMYSALGGWRKWKCSVTKESPFQCLCENREQVYLTLRGLCRDSNIDRHWVTRNIRAELYYLGIQNSEMWYDYTNRNWQMKAVGKPELTAGTSDSSFHSFLLGKSTWYIERDNDGK